MSSFSSDSTTSNARKTLQWKSNGEFWNVIVFQFRIDLQLFVFLLTSAFNETVNYYRGEYRCKSELILYIVIGSGKLDD